MRFDEFERLMAGQWRHFFKPGHIRLWRSIEAVSPAERWKGWFPDMFKKPPACWQL